MSSDSISTASTVGVPNPSRVTAVYVGIFVPTAISSIFVVARLYTRTILTKNWGVDDTLISIAWVLSLCLMVSNSLFPKYGTGHHAAFQPFEDIVPTLKLAFVSRLIYQIVICITKVGICFFYLRVFTDKTSKRFVYGLMGFIVLSGLVTELLFIFGCTPVSDWWKLGDANCMPTDPDTLATAVVNVTADLALMAFVIPRVIPLQMHIRQKISLLCVVSLGVLVVAAAIVRAYLVVHFAGNADISWVGYQFTTWTTVESATGLFCASAPTIRPLLRKVAPGFMSSISKTYATPSNGQSGNPSRYGVGTQRSKMRQGQGFELRSQSEQEFGEQFVNAKTKTGTTNNFWTGKNDPSDDDESSERGVLGAAAPNGGKKDIVKTVSVTVRGEQDVERGYAVPKAVGRDYV